MMGAILVDIFIANHRKKSHPFITTIQAPVPAAAAATVVAVVVLGAVAAAVAGAAIKRSACIIY
jgi:hypothetical protein